MRRRRRKNKGRMWVRCEGGGEEEGEDKERMNRSRGGEMGGGI